MSKYKAMWRGSLIRFIEYGLDIFIMMFSLLVAIQVHHGIVYGTYFPWSHIIGMYWNYYWLLLVLYIFMPAIMLKMYHTTIINNSYKNSIINTIMAIFFINIPLVIYNIIRWDNFIFKTPLYFLVIIFIEIVIYAIYKYIFYRILCKFDRQESIIIGEENDVKELAKKFLITNARHQKIKYLYFINNDEVLDEKVFDLVNKVQSVYITESLNPKSKEILIDYTSFKNYKEVYIIPNKSEILMLDSKFSTIDDTMLLHTKNMHLSFEMRFIKRTIDLVVAVLGLIIAAVPMLIVALIIKLQDGGKVFYKQERFKRNHESFYILKFRSMTEKQTKEQEQTLATAHDSRITKFGKFIRATRLDELPQLINVLKGEMSLVGPRPFMKSVIDEATTNNPDFRYRSNVKPGITGLSHVYGRYDTTPEERLRFDLLYVRKCSLWLDLKIMFLTIIIIFNKEAGLGKVRELSFDELIKENNQEIIKSKNKNHTIIELI